MDFFCISDSWGTGPKVVILDFFATLSNLGSAIIEPAVNAAMERYQFIQGGVTEEKLQEILSAFKNDMMAGKLELLLALLLILIQVYLTFQIYQI